MSSAGDALAALGRRGETLATAESLTGGLLGSVITGTPGASVSYVGGLIVYATRLKAELADVSPATLQADGPVAATTAEELAVGVARRCGADWGLSTTGVAGPDPVDDHPVGQVFIGLAHPVQGVTRVRELKLVGDRADIRIQVVTAALELLLSELDGMPAADDALDGRRG